MYPFESITERGKLRQVAASANASTTKPHAFKIELCGFNPIMVVTRMKSIVCDGRHKKVKQYREK